MNRREFMKGAAALVASPYVPAAPVTGIPATAQWLPYAGAQFTLFYGGRRGGGKVWASRSAITAAAMNKLADNVEKEVGHALET